MKLEKTQLILLLRSIQFSSNPDVTYWHLDKTGTYIIVHTLCKYVSQLWGNS
jgi:hypothetical protein